MAKSTDQFIFICDVHSNWPTSLLILRVYLDGGVNIAIFFSNWDVHCKKL